MTSRLPASRSTAGLLALAAITFWIAWHLMPDQGTADPTHILRIVAQHRTSVLTSVVVQIISSVLYLSALLLLVRCIVPSGTTITGTIFLAIGAMGMCMDAFFHLLAYHMTDPALSPIGDIAQLMGLMQAEGLLFLVPLLLPFFIGSLLLGIGLHRQRVVSARPQWIFITAFVLGIIGAIIARNFLPDARPLIVLTILGLFAFGQLLVAYGLFHRTRQ